MENRIEYTISDPSILNQLMTGVYGKIKRALEGGAVVLTLSRKNRTAPQNKKMWPLLTDWSSQITHSDGKKYTKEDWKDILSAAFEGALRYAPNVDGTGLIALGVRTSIYNKHKFSEFIEFIYAEGSKRGIDWSNYD